MDCGATCLRIVARHYGKTVSLPFLREQSHTTRTGTNMNQLSHAAEAIGFRSMVAKISLEQLEQEAPLPAIVHWNQQHFVVVYKISARKVWVSDPANGLLSYTHAQFLQHWIGENANKETRAGIILLLEPSPSFHDLQLPESEEAKTDTRAFLWHYIRPYRKVMLQVLLSLLLGSGLQLLVPFLTQNMVDTGIYKRDIHFVWLVLLAQLMLTLGQIALELMRSWMLLHVSYRISISLLSDFFAKLMRLPIRYFDSKLSGDLLQRITDHQRIESFLTGTSLSALFALFTLTLYSCILAYYSLLLFTVFTIGSILYTCWMLFFLKLREKLDYKRFQQAGSSSSKTIELINGMQEIKLHNAEQQKRWGWERIQIKLYHIGIQSLRLEQTQGTGSQLINELKNLLTTIIAAKLVIDGQLTLGMMLSVSYIIGQLNAPVLQLTGLVKSWQDARISLDRLTEIHTLKNESASNVLTVPVPTDHTFVFNAVSFAYEGGADAVLHHLNLCIPAGKVTAIVGSSGSGKTTLLKLLMRFYEPSSGTISIGPTPLAATDLQQWRHCCGVVMQEGFLFNDTIAGNIAVGEEHPDWNRLNEAARMACISEFITQLPLGFKTKIGMEGMGISGGQKQRILIARAIYKNPRILCFDEATSSLDAANEMAIMQHLGQFYEGRTVVIVAHRLSTVRHAHNIIVLEKGTIVEEGPHETLIAQQGYYYNLIKNQLELGV